MNWVSVSNADIFLERCLLQLFHQTKIPWNSLIELVSARPWPPPPLSPGIPHLPSGAAGIKMTIQDNELFCMNLALLGRRN